MLRFIYEIIIVDGFWLIIAAVCILLFWWIMKQQKPSKYPGSTEEKHRASEEREQAQNSCGLTNICGTGQLF